MAASPPVPPVLRPNRALAYMVAAAAFVVAGLALVGLAWMMGWIAPRAAVYSPAAVAPVNSVTPVAPVARAPANADGLEPGETVVSTAASRTQPMMPTYSQPLAPAPAPTTADPVSTPPTAPAAARKPPLPVTPATTPKREAYVQADPAAPGPTAPSFTRNAAVCENCGVVSAITTYPPGLWEVRVRMQDGDLQAFHFRRQPAYRIGDRVRTDGSRITPE